MIVHVNFNMRIVHTKEVRLLREVTGVKQTLVKNGLPGRGSFPGRYLQQDDEID